MKRSAKQRTLSPLLSLRESTWWLTLYISFILIEIVFWCIHNQGIGFCSDFCGHPITRLIILGLEQKLEVSRTLNTVFPSFLVLKRYSSCLWADEHPLANCLDHSGKWNACYFKTESPTRSYAKCDFRYLAAYACIMVMSLFHRANMRYSDIRSQMSREQKLA